MMREYARPLDDSLECDRGVFFSCAWEGGERADVNFDGRAGGMFGGESGGYGSTDGGKGGDLAEGEAGRTVDAGESVEGDMDGLH